MHARVHALPVTTDAIVRLPVMRKANVTLIGGTLSGTVVRDGQGSPPQTPRPLEATTGKLAA